MRIARNLLLCVIVLSFVSFRAYPEDSPSTSPLTMVVMDPLAKPLSCPCVAGYAQRDYEKLAEALKKSLGREVTVVFNESLVAARKKKQTERIDIIIGKQSVIVHDAKESKLNLQKVAMLSGKDGLTTQRGLLVVATADPAKQISDLKDYRIYFGPPECDEKHAAAKRLLTAAGIKIPAKLDTAVACDEGAIKILEMAEKGGRGCAVISSYAKPLLEGCGQVKKGALRVIGETEEVPFVAAYINADLDPQLQTAIKEALVKSTGDVKLRIALETRQGFVVDDDSQGEVAKKK